MRVVSLLNSGVDINTVVGKVCYYQCYDHVDDVDDVDITVVLDLQ